MTNILPEGQKTQAVILLLFFMFFFFQAGVAVEIIRVLPESPPPNLSNIFCQSTDINPSDMVRHAITDHSDQSIISQLNFFADNYAGL